MMKRIRSDRMICEIIRGLVIVSRTAEAVEELADKTGFSCDEAPCFRERDGEDDEREGMGCDSLPCRRDDEDDFEEEEEIIEVKAETVKDPEPAKKAEPVKKSEPAKKARPAKKTEPAKKAGSGKKTEPAKKEEKKEDKK